ncbi:MAG: ribonuclease HI [Planctomycetota bacterium]|jgi:ribonuclease HI
MGKKKKFYVVWAGKQPGIYTHWNECQKQIKGYPNAKFKGFLTREIAEEALLNPSKFLGKKVVENSLSAADLDRIGKPNLESISVDGAGNNQTGVVEYQGVFTATKTLLFHKGPLVGGTNNIVEFLALVHAIAYCQKHKIQYPIYSDSRTAMSWVRNKKAKTTAKVTPDNVEIMDLVNRAETWLKTHSFSNRVLKWETKAWGEIPADFGRK